ncbi:hypothetical protein [Cellulomonas fengjieae]|uniref:hypothetical protein n=1 Tax=Cellulomonas fengjieae TaxID=2819978 RepID=UPI001AAEDB10|nr:hypothetical protein [Cellulomonas fengjieae]MBO3101621.1 hypothetical protein [Cellulomonas fengjieae]
MRHRRPTGGRAAEVLDGSMVPGWFETLAIVAGTTVAVAAFVGAFAYMYSRRRVFTRGVRGTAVVVAVQPASLFQRRSVVASPKDRVTVATQARPRGVTVDQLLPVGQYRVGQVVPVVQRSGHPDRLFLDRPDLERSALAVYAPLAMVAMTPVILYAALTGQS